MEIDIPKPQQDRLVADAAAAGYEGVEQYVAEYVMATLAEGAEAAECFRPPTEQELADSLAMCEVGIAQARAGEGYSVKEARSETLRRLGQEPE